MTSFRDMHPLVLLLYYIVIITVTVMTMHPVIILISLTGASVYMMLSEGKINDFLIYIIIMVLVTMLNPIFSHNGENILFYINDNPVTVESIFYGVISAVMIAGVLIWCRNMLKDITMDKFIYITGRTLPNISLILSMVMRFIPMYRKHAAEVEDVQSALGIYNQENWYDKVRNKLRVYDSVLGWAIENSVDTADSMKARGYGNRGRTQFSRYNWHLWDTIMMIFIICFIVCVIIGRNQIAYSFYPVMDRVNLSENICLWIIVGVFMSIPVIVEIKEKIKWNYLKSRI